MMLNLPSQGIMNGFPTSEVLTKTWKIRLIIHIIIVVIQIAPLSIYYN